MILRIPAPEAAATPSRHEPILWLELAENLGGAWTELRDGIEVIRFGYPAASRYRWFQIFADPGRRHHALSLALERMVFARSIDMIEYGHEALLPALRRAVAVHPGTRLAPWNGGVR